MSTAFVYCATCGAANPPEATACFACGNPPLIADAEASGDSHLPTTIASRGLLKQRYRLLAQVGRGGFGAVYQAEDIELGNRKVAVKEMSRQGLTPEELQEATQAFHNEALLLARLAHPSLPHIYEQFSEGGHWYLVMDFIEGETLEEHLGRAPGGRLPVPEVLKLGVHLCTVLDYLHTRQPPIIFRDLKPANIMLTQNGDLSLIDFGIARHFKPGQAKDTIALGSAGYAAPEQYGKAQTTTQADIYSLGATLHQMLSGSDPSDKPFLFAPLHLIAPEGLEALIMHMVGPDPSQRPASAAIIKQDLQRMTDDLATGRKPQKPAVTLAPSPGGVVLKPLLLYRGHFDQINAVAWSPDGNRIASGGNDQTIHIWESASGKKRHALIQTGVVHALAWSPTGDQQLVWVSGGMGVLLWNASMSVYHKAVCYQARSTNTGFLALAWSPDGTRLAAGGLGSAVEVWEAQTGTHLLTYKGHQRFFGNAKLHSVRWSPDGAWIASASTDAAVQVWDATTGTLRSAYQGHGSGSGSGVAWAPNAAYLASAGSENTVLIWDAATANVSLVLKGHTKPVQSVAWSPDGKYLASGSSDQTVRVWDVAQAREALMYIHREGAVKVVAWSPDSLLIASAGRDHQIHIWRAA